MDEDVDAAKPRFLGEHSHQIDGKNRLTLPSTMREKLPDEGLILSAGFDQCLTLFPESEFGRFMEEAVQKGPTAEARQLRRQFSALASEVDLDSQGRFVLPQNLKEWADIDGTVQVVGNFDRIELWSPEQWDDYCQDTDLEQAAQQLFQGEN